MTPKTSRTFRGAPSWTIAHVDGIAWHDAPAPPRKHKHWVQTEGCSTWGLEIVQRCPCGAIRTLGSGRPYADEWAMISPDVPRVAPRRTLRQILSDLFARKA